MAHRTKPTPASTGSSANYRAALNKWNKEHKGGAKAKPKEGQTRRVKGT